MFTIALACLDEKKVLCNNESRKKSWWGKKFKHFHNQIVNANQLSAIDSREL
jgi:hypothetical protein